MVHFLFSALILFFSFLFLIMNHPLSMGLILMIQTMLIALFSGLLTKNFWFSYSLFLIFLGGMLILFIYMTSIASNESFKMKFNFKILMFFSVFFFTLLMMILFFDLKIMFFNKFMNMNTMKMNSLISLTTENNYSLNKLFNFPTNYISILLMNYLFLTLIATVKITNIFEGPLRVKN